MISFTFMILNPIQNLNNKNHRFVQLLLPANPPSRQLRVGMAATRQPLNLTHHHSRSRVSYCSPRAVSIAKLGFSECHATPKNLKLRSVFRSVKDPLVAVKASSEDKGIDPAIDDDEGVSLGTMKLPPNIDIPRFEILLFQWANSLCQGANLPLPVPLKVDRIQGGARLGFIRVDDGKTEVWVYIDCRVFPATESSGPLFRAVRNGPLRNQVAPGEPRIMRSLLQALKTSVEIATT